MLMYVPVSPGEALDRLSILEIKSEHTEDAFVASQLKHYRAIVCSCIHQPVSGIPDYSELHEVNSILWDLENSNRACPDQDIFMKRKLAKDIFEYNIRRAELKKQIDLHFDSQTDEKVYSA